MANIIDKINVAGQFFVGQADMVIFDKITDYSTGKLSTLANPQSLGDILADSTNLSGEDPSITAIKNEQGQSFVSSVEEGTFGFELVVADTSADMLQALMNAEIISDTFTDGVFSSGSTVTGLMHKPTVSERPIMIIANDRESAIVVPRAKIIASLTMEEKVISIKLTVQAEKVDTANLKTVMFVKGKVKE